MKFESRFNIGDKVWAITSAPPNGKAIIENVTVGQIRIEHTDSKGRPGEQMFDNYMPQQSHREVYMCDETGIGSGSLFELGKNIFATEKECQDQVAGKL